MFRNLFRRATYLFKSLFASADTQPNAPVHLGSMEVSGNTSPSLPYAMPEVVGAVGRDRTGVYCLAYGASAHSGIDSASASTAISSAEVVAFLKLVAEGEQEQAEIDLKSKPNLAVGAGNVRDLSGRTFNSITALQYAVWALDWQMWEMIIRYMSREDISIQLSAMATAPWLMMHGVTAEKLIRDLLTELQRVVTDSTSEQWEVKVRTAQRYLPVHVINEYCNPNEPFYPLPDFKAAKRYQRGWRTRTTDRGGWFTEPFSGKVESDSSFTYYRAIYAGVRYGMSGGGGVLR